jgi:glutamyl-tRNA reductase
MTGIWGWVATAEFADVETRARVARQAEDWLAVGNAGIPLLTCHRAELYGLGQHPTISSARLLAGSAATEHLMRVAAGLESAIVGEDEVLHQVRESLVAAHARGPIDLRLRRLIEMAIATGRKSRSKRTESSGNLAQKAVAWMRSRSDIAGQMVIVAGAGRMGSALAHSLAGAGATLVVASRDRGRASRLAGVYGGTAVSLLGGARLAEHAAGIGVALAGPWAELSVAHHEALPPIADVSAPQAVPDSIRRSLNGRFLGVDDLYGKSGTIPSGYIRDAELLVARGTAEFSNWLAGIPA